MATIDDKGVCLVSDVTTANYKFHMEAGESQGKFDYQKFFSATLK